MEKIELPQKMDLDFSSNTELVRETEEDAQKFKEVQLKAKTAEGQIQELLEQLDNLFYEL